MAGSIYLNVKWLDDGAKRLPSHFRVFRVFRGLFVRVSSVFHPWPGNSMNLQCVPRQVGDSRQFGEAGSNEPGCLGRGDRCQ